MVLIDGNLDPLRKCCVGKQELFKSNFKTATAVDLHKCLRHVKLPITRAHTLLTLNSSSTSTSTFRPGCWPTTSISELSCL